MALLEVLKAGNPVLKQVSVPVERVDKKLKKLMDDMAETMYENDGVGLAAPQIGLPIRLSVIDLRPLAEDMPEYKEFHQTYINPHIIETDDTHTDTSEEGCLSLPAIHEKVTRPTRIHVKWQDEEFQQHDEWVEGYLARVMQHEFDHLDGHMFIDHISPLRKQLIKSKLKALTQGRYRCAYKTKPVLRK